MAGSSTDRSPRKTIILGAIIAVLLVAGFVWFVRTMMASKTSKPERQVQVVQIIRPPPPPPPPSDQPPPPPPEKTEQALPKDQPEEHPPDDAPPPAAPLGIDAEGSAGSDAFGLAARTGGGDLIGGTGSNVFAWYTRKINEAIKDILAADGKLASKPFSTSVRIWVDREGRVKVQMATTTGNRDLDQRIQSDLAAMPAMSDAPPLEMPQPVTLKIVQHS